MKKLTFLAPDQLLDPLSARLFQAGAGALQEGPGSLTAYVASEQEEASLRDTVSQMMGDLPPQYLGLTIEIELEEIDDSWQATWQSALEAVALTECWVLRPTHQLPAPENEDTIWFQPQASFGDGSHPTTQLAARALVEWMRTRNQDAAKPKVLDVGTGNGVLSLLALKEAQRSDHELGRLLALDTDEVAVNSFKQNLSLNAISEASVEIRLGTLSKEADSFDLVVANINTPVLVELASPLTSCLAPLGTLLITGLLVEDEQQLRATYAGLGVELISTTRQGEWSLLLFQSTRSAPSANP